MKSLIFFPPAGLLQTSPQRCCCRVRALSDADAWGAGNLAGRSGNVSIDIPRDAVVAAALTTLQILDNDRSSENFAAV